ncbi:MAG: transporter substrate-binding domain-containing protein [Halarcobacter sp.]
MHFLKIFILILLVSNIYAKTDIELTDKEIEFLKNNSPIRLHNEQNWPPYNYFENGKPKGFSIDYMNLLAKKLDIKVKYITGPSWDEFMQMLQNDQLDAIINISKNAQRAKNISFTSIFHTAANAIYVKKGNESIDSLDKLEGKTIVMPKGFFAQKAIEKYYPKIKQILVKDSLEALKFLSLGKADATIGKKNVLDYVIALNNISGVVPTNFIYDNRMISLIRIGTSKDKTILRDIFEKAMQTVSDEELLSLKRKWFGVRKVEKKENNKLLSNEENEFIQNKKVITVCTRKNLKPIDYYENGNYLGISIDILEKIEELTGIEFQTLKVKSLSQLKSYLKLGLCEVVSSVTNTQDILEYVKFTEPYLDYKLAIITKKDKPVVSSLESILEKKVAVKQNSQIEHLLKLSNKNPNIIYTKNDKDSFNLVNLGQVYYTIQPLPIASYYMSNYALNDLYISRYTNMSYKVSMAVNRNSDERLLNILNKSLNHLSQKQINEISNKWTAINISSIFDYKYFWQLFFSMILILIIFIYRQTILNRHNKVLQKAKEEIENKTIELAKQKKLFENLYIKSADGVLLIKDNIIINCNESSLKILNRTKDKILNSKLYELSPEYQTINILSKKQFEEKIKETKKNGVSSFEWIILDGKGKKIDVEIVLTLIQIDNNDVIHAVIRDITIRKHLEKELAQLNSTLENRVKEEIKKNELNTKQLIEKSRLAQMGEMLAMIAHQWRQPLTAISATTNNLIMKTLIHNNLDKKTFEEELKLIANYSNHLSTTIDDFRNFFKNNKEKSNFNLEQLIFKSIDLVKNSLTQNSIDLRTKFNCSINLISYPNEIQQVLLNLIKNSEDILIENNKEKRIIEIETSKKDNKFAIIRIYDNGGGIDEEVIEKIFDPYFSTKLSKDGTGLGLYMSKIIINDHCKGSLFAKNEYNGISFYIHLPLDDKELL